MSNTDKTCYIFAAGDYGSIIVEKNYLAGGYVIAADGGYAYLKQIGVTPNLVVGDFDSLCYTPTDIEVIKHPVEKDDTDMMLAVDEGFRRGYDNFIIYGGLGGRLDHTLANIQVLTDISNKGGTGYLCDGDITVMAVNKTVSFTKDCSGTISIFCIGDSAKGVTIKGLKYEVVDTELCSSIPLGVSNEFIGKPVDISLKTGCLIVMFSATIPLQNITTRITRAK